MQITLFTGLKLTPSKNDRWLVSTLKDTQIHQCWGFERRWFGWWYGMVGSSERPNPEEFLGGFSGWISRCCRTVGHVGWLVFRKGKNFDPLCVWRWWDVDFFWCWHFRRTLSEWELFFYKRSWRDQPAGMRYSVFRWVVVSYICFIFIPKLGEDEPNLTSIFFTGVGSTTN